MARFLFVTWNGGGTIPPAFGIAQALHEGGHEAVFAGQELMPATDAAGAGRGLLEARAAAHGFRFARLERSSAAWLKESPERRIVTAVMASQEHLRDLPDAVAREGCDVLVIDGLMFGALAAAEGTDLPVAVLVTSAPSATAAPGGPLDTRLLAAVNEVRAVARRAAIDRLWDAWARFPTLCATIPELDPLADQVPPSFAYVGPAFERVPISGCARPGRGTTPGRWRWSASRPRAAGTKPPASSARSRRWRTAHTACWLPPVAPRPPGLPFPATPGSSRTCRMGRSSLRRRSSSPTPATARWRQRSLTACRSSACRTPGRTNLPWRREWRTSVLARPWTVKPPPPKRSSAPWTTC